MRPILALTAAALVAAPAFADPVAPGAYDYIDGCIVLNSDTLIAYGTAPIAFPRPIFSCGDPTSAGATASAPDPTPGVADMALANATAAVAEFQPPPDIAKGDRDAHIPSHVPSNALAPHVPIVRPGDALAVPEPAAVGLVGFGLSAIGLRRKRNNRAAR